MKTQILFSLLFLYTGSMFGQSVVYDDFEGKKLAMYGVKNGTLDTMAKNPSVDKINSSAMCAKYVRNREKKFDNIKMTVPRKLIDVSPYATYAGNPPRLKMKIYTDAPAGTLVEILLGSKGRNNEFPEGTHSQFQAYTTKSGAWEELEFKFSQVPKGSLTTAVEVDQITLLFNPNSSTSHTYYFDDLTGPGLMSELVVSPGNAGNK